MKKRHKHRHKHLPYFLFLLLFLAIPAGEELQEQAQFQLHKKSIVELLAPDSGGGGTGFQIEFKSRQYTMTNGHVCALGKKEGFMVMVSPYARVRKLRILDESPYTDLCLLEPATSLPALKLGDSDLPPSQTAQVLGHPLLGPLTLTSGSVTTTPRYVQVLMGSISNQEEENACQQPKNRIMEIEFFGPMRICTIDVEAQHTTAHIEPGNSGSPVLDVYGRVRGVAFAANREDGEAEILPWSQIEFFLNHHIPYYKQNASERH